MAPKKKKSAAKKKKNTARRRSEAKAMARRTESGMPPIAQDRYSGWLGVMECLELCAPSEVISLICARCREPLPGLSVSKFLDRNRRAAVHDCRKCGTGRFTLKYLMMIEGRHLFALNSQHLRSIYNFMTDPNHDIKQVPDRYRRLTGQLPIWFFAPGIGQKAQSAVTRMLPEAGE